MCVCVHEGCSATKKAGTPSGLEAYVQEENFAMHSGQRTFLCCRAALLSFGFCNSGWSGCSHFIVEDLQMWTEWVGGHPRAHIVSSKLSKEDRIENTDLPKSKSPIYHSPLLLVHHFC